jgi:photosystem II PsbM protein
MIVQSFRIHLYFFVELYFTPKKEHWNKIIMEVNISAFIATALSISIPTAFLLILYVRTAGQSN